MVDGHLRKLSWDGQLQKVDGVWHAEASAQVAQVQGVEGLHLERRQVHSALHRARTALADKQAIHYTQESFVPCMLASFSILAASYGLL